VKDDGPATRKLRVLHDALFQRKNKMLHTVAQDSFGKKPGMIARQKKIT